jgi:hypothetical protein
VSAVTIEQVGAFDLPCAPASGERICVIGDIHGRSDLLEPLLERANKLLAGKLGRLVLLGDCDSFFDVLGSLGRQGLRYPIAEMTGPNVEVRRRGIAMLRAALSALKPPENESLDEPGSERGRDGVTNDLTYRGQPILFIDLEASSLDPRGYPIEIGWAAADGLISVTHDSMLIRPTIDWRESGHWSEESAAVHCMIWGDLMRDGMDVMDAVSRIDATFAGKTLVSDAPDTDLRWLAMVYEAVDRTCPWRMHDLALVRRGIVAEMDLNPRTAFAALDLEEAKEPRPHRADPDAVRMARLTQIMIAAGKR